MADTERRYSVPESVFEHLQAAHEVAQEDEALYHIREAIQISKSEISTTMDIDGELSE